MRLIPSSDATSALVPCLPQTDPDPDQRSAQLAGDRTLYQLSRDYHQIPLPKEIPPQANFSTAYQARKATLEAQLVSNNLISSVRQSHNSPNGGWHNQVRSLKESLTNKLLNRMWGPPRDATILPYDCRTPVSLASYEAIFQTIEPPVAIQYWKEDWYFAWQRLTGVNPDLLTLVDDRHPLPDYFPMTAALFQQAVGSSPDTFERAQQEHRLFVVDFHSLHRIPTGITEGWRKYQSAPIGLFYLDPSRTTLRPIAIQCDHRPSPHNPIFTPGDEPNTWLLAKTVFQVADSVYQGVVSHGAYCHILMGAIAVYTYRNLAPNHPLRVLLHPHFEFTIPIAVATRQLVLVPGGNTPTLQSTSLQGAIQLTHWALNHFDWNQASVPEPNARTGIWSPEILPMYPYRDDTLRLWDAIHAFVSRYVRVYYTSDADVTGDREVQSWLHDLSAPSGANIRGMGRNGKIETIEQLIRFIAQIIHRATAYHAAVNYSVFPAMGFVPNMPGSAYAPFPQEDESGHALKSRYSISDWLHLLPPRDIAVGQLEDVYVVGNLRANQIGDYGCNYFVDLRVRPLVDEFQRQLQHIEFAISEDNKTRPVPYELLLPSQITASIHI